MSAQDIIQYKNALAIMSRKITSGIYTANDVRDLQCLAESLYMELDIKSTTNDALFQHLTQSTRPKEY